MVSGIRDISFDLKHVNLLSIVLEYLAAGDIDVILLDLTLPDSSGLETFTKVQTQVPEVAILALTYLNDVRKTVHTVYPRNGLLTNL